jgi:hypothetical protein
MLIIFTSCFTSKIAERVPDMKPAIKIPIEGVLNLGLTFEKTLKRRPSDDIASMTRGRAVKAV